MSNSFCQLISLRYAIKKSISKNFAFSLSNSLNQTRKLFNLSATSILFKSLAKTKRYQSLIYELITYFQRKTKESMSDWTKSKKELSNNKEIEKMSESASKFLGGILGDISSRSAYSQLFIGVASGWATGFATGKIGKVAAFAIGGGIIVMEIAHQEGYIKVDWSKVTKKIDKVTDKVEEAVTGQERSWADKAERFVDRKLDRAEEIIKNKAKKGKKWYSNLIGDEHGPKLNDLHIFLTAFVGGVAIGIASA